MLVIAMGGGGELHDYPKFLRVVSCMDNSVAFKKGVVILNFCSYTMK